MKIIHKVVIVNINDNDSESWLMNCMLCGGELTVKLNHALLMTWIGMSYPAYHELWYGVIQTRVAHNGKGIWS